MPWSVRWQMSSKLQAQTAIEVVASKPDEEKRALTGLLSSLPEPGFTREMLIISDGDRPTEGDVRIEADVTK